MFYKSFMTSLVITIANRFNHFLMISPYFLQIIVPPGEHVQTHGFVGFPISFKDARDKRVLEPAEDFQV
jgi:hypothetical protein